MLLQFLHTHYAYTIDFGIECFIYRNSVYEKAAYIVQTMGFKFKNPRSLHKRRLYAVRFWFLQKMEFPV